MLFLGKNLEKEEELNVKRAEVAAMHQQLEVLEEMMTCTCAHACSERES